MRTSTQRWTRTIVFLSAFTATIAAASGCSSIAKSPGRCVGCCYDQCIVPIGSPQNARGASFASASTAPASSSVPAVGVTMAY